MSNQTEIPEDNATWTVVEQSFSEQAIAENPIAYFPSVKAASDYIRFLQSSESENKTWYMRAATDEVTKKHKISEDRLEPQMHPNSSSTRFWESLTPEWTDRAIIIDRSGLYLRQAKKLLSKWLDEGFIERRYLPIPRAGRIAQYRKITRNAPDG